MDLKPIGMKLIFISLFVKQKGNIKPFAFFHSYTSKKTLEKLSQNKNSSVIFFCLFYLSK